MTTLTFACNRPITPNSAEIMLHMLGITQTTTARLAQDVLPLINSPTKTGPSRRVSFSYEANTLHVNVSSAKKASAIVFSRTLPITYTNEELFAHILETTHDLPPRHASPLAELLAVYHDPHTCTLDVSQTSGDINVFVRSKETGNYVPPSVAISTRDYRLINPKLRL